MPSQSHSHQEQREDPCCVGYIHDLSFGPPWIGYCINIKEQELGGEGNKTKKSQSLSHLAKKETHFYKDTGKGLHDSMVLLHPWP